MIGRAIRLGEVGGAIPADCQEPRREIRLPVPTQPFKLFAQGDGDGSGLALACQFGQFSR